MPTGRKSAPRPRDWPTLRPGRFPADLDRALDAMLDRLLLIGLVIYPFLLAGFVYRIVVHGWRSNILLQVGFYLLLVAAWVWRRRLGFRTRALGFTAFIFVAGAAGVFQWGLVGMGILSLFFAVLFTSNLVHPRQTYAALVLAVLVILGVGYGAVNGHLHRDLDVAAYVTSWNGWLVAVIQFALFLLVILTVFHTLYDELIRMFEGAEQRALELEESRARLDAEVSQRQELEAQFIQAQKMEAVGRLAGGVAHDFNNHLFVITSMTEALGRKMGPDSPHQRGLEVILQSARRSAELTRQLLSFSRKQTIQPRVLNLNEVVQGIESMLRRLIGESVQLVVELEPALELTSLDQAHLEQAVVNLAVNARDAMTPGGTLVLRTSNRRGGEGPADAARVPTGRFVVLQVSDTGSGMSPETMAHVFEPFFTTKERGKGTGLGLASVYGFVKQSGGEVLVESAEGAGSTFTLWFPRFELEADPESTAVESAAVEGGHETVLVVEDEEQVRDLVRALLEEMGYGVIPCAHAEEALSSDDERLAGVDLLVTDLVLPRMTGKDLADRLRARKPSLGLVFISGYSEDVISDHGVPQDGAHFLQKPFDYVTLGRTVREALAGRPVSPPSP